MSTKLQLNDLVAVHGFVMLEGLIGGHYRVSKITTINGKEVYWFSKPKGKKVIVGHFAKNVDIWISPPDCADLNKIVVCTPCSPPAIETER